MKMMQWRWLLAAAAVVLAGCASQTKLDEGAPVETRTPASTSDAASAAGSASGTSQSQVTSVDLTRQSADALKATPRVIYFDFDSYIVKDQYRDIVELYAKVLSADRSRRLVIEGHTDERGSREYNLALGQRRAEAVAKAIELLGANASQIESVSFGKERPAVPGSDEAAMAQNRRAVLKLQ
ncbi:MAG TPA: peptidoglycan-associated lipoprotein Pal [Burkholderiaceae bacterium]|nr:peptidoglycan-associated lipoprotein Pal [Burkholderiaceae bacterium]